jgi:predicted nucleic acid-binding protein
MKYLVDTNVISEMTKAKPNPNVVKWFDDNFETDMFLSVVDRRNCFWNIETFR